MTLVIFDPDARAEFLGSVQYYESCQKGLGKRFSNAIESAVKNICESPLLFRTLKPPFRRYLLLKFPYSIIYSIEKKHIYILALAHNKRKPGYWYKRLSNPEK